MITSASSTAFDMMERPAKRQRMDWDRDFLSESESDAILDQDALEKEHKRNILAVRNKLKHRFEDIFQKYERDFSGIGDEVDLETGEVIINNGHLNRMRDEQDADGMSDGSIATSDSDSCLEGHSSLHGRCSSGPDPAGREFNTPVPRLKRPPQDPRWAAPEIPGLSHDLATFDDSKWASEPVDDSPERSPSPEVSLWSMPVEGVTKDDKEPRARWTLDELTLLCRLKNMDRNWKVAEIREMLPHRGFASVQKRWLNIEKGGDPASYLQNKRGGKVVPKRSPSQSSQTSSSDAEDGSETEADDLALPTPVRGTKSHLAATPQSHRIALSPTIKGEPQIAVSPAVENLAKNETAPLSSSPITNALAWLSRSADITSLENTAAPTRNEKTFSKAFTQIAANKAYSRKWEPGSAETVRSGRAAGRSIPTERVGQHRMAECPASVSSDEEDGLLETGVGTNPTHESHSHQSSRLHMRQPLQARPLAREIPDSDDPVSSSQSIQRQQQECTIPDSEDFPESSSGAVAPEISAMDDKEATPARRMPLLKASHSTGRKKPTVTASRKRMTFPKCSRSPGSSLSILEMSSDNEQVASSDGPSASASQTAGTGDLPSRNITASEKRPQCGREGFSCGRILCLRCA